MHPIERLRHVARAAGADPVELVAAAARALAGFADDPAGLVAAARRMVARQPGLGPMWWMASRVVVAPDPWDEARRVRAELETDETAAEVERRLPDEARVLVVGWPATVIPALARRGDLEVLAVDDGGGSDLGRLLARVDVEVEELFAEAVGAGASVADVVVLEAAALGPDHVLCAPGSLAAAAVARASGRSVWLAAPVGASLPGPLFDACVGPVLDPAEPWRGGRDLVPRSLIDEVVGAVDPTCPIAPELLRAARTPGSHEP